MQKEIQNIKSQALLENFLDEPILITKQVIAEFMS
jgi:hypothetical protein